jgi:excisionase family DNA binding protein
MKKRREKSPLPRLVVSVPEAARMLGWSESWMWKLVAQGRIASFKAGSKRCIRVTAINAYLDELELEPSSDVTAKAP